MKEQIRRSILLLLTLIPVVSVAFAAQSALNIAQIGVTTTSDGDLGKSGQESTAA